MLIQLHEKIILPQQLKTVLASWQKHHQKVVFTNGCFDLIHQGHVRYLYQARKKGDRLIVALNSDESIKKIKGKKRPIVSLEARMEIIAGFYFVDAVTFFEERHAL